jgi:DNA polymerase elongation subunit (family B)
LKLLFWDVETSTIELRLQTYGLRVNISRFSHEDITRDWSLLSAAWKFEGGDIECIAVSPRDVFNDEKVVRKLHKVLSEADVLVGHNADAFDLKKFNTRALYYGLDPIAQKPSVDTLKVARKHFVITSNKLAYLATYLKIGSKDESPDWKKILDGNREEIARMKTYNMKDVEVTEKIYRKIRPWMTNHPVRECVKDIAGNDLPTCEPCGSANLQYRGYLVTKAGKKARMQCQDCGAWRTIGRAKR